MRARMACGAVALLTFLTCAACQYANATSVIPLTMEDRVREAGTIFVGRVIAHQSHWGRGSGSWMETDYVVQVEDAILPDDAVMTGHTVTVTFWGGTIGNERQSDWIR
jgi:hypothetical protein